MAKHFPTLQALSIGDNRLGREGVVTISRNMMGLKNIGMNNNKEVMQAMWSIGRLPNLRKLSARNTGVRDWTVVAIANQLRRLEELRIGEDSL